MQAREIISASPMAAGHARLILSSACLCVRCMWCCMCELQVRVACVRVASGLHAGLRRAASCLHASCLHRICIVFAWGCMHMQVRCKSDKPPCHTPWGKVGPTYQKRPRVIKVRGALSARLLLLVYSASRGSRPPPAPAARGLPRSLFPLRHKSISSCMYVYWLCCASSTSAGVIA